MNKKLLIIGAGREQVLAYQIAKSMGLYVIGTDMNPNAPAFEFTDKKLICSTRDVSETLDTVTKYANVNSINGVMTIANDVPLTVASLAEKLGLPGISVQSAKFASNKILMKKQFEKFGIPTPSYFIIENEDEFSKKIPELTNNIILKPSDGRGSRGVLLLDKKSDFKWAWKHSLSYSDNKKLLVEEFVDGDQLSVEGIFVNGKYHSIAFADRNYSNLHSTKPFIVEDGGVIPSKHEVEILGELSELVAHTAASLGINFGSVKADIVLSKRGPVIIELAARLSGNYLATHHIPMAYGIDIVSAVIKLSLGLKIDKRDLSPKQKKFLGVRYFFPKSGTIKSIEGVEGIKALSYVKMFEIFRKEGDFQSKIQSHADRAGTIVCEGSNYEEALKRVEMAVNEIKFDIS